MLKLSSTRSPWNTTLTLNGNTNIFAFYIFDPNIFLHPCIHGPAGEIWASRNGSGWNIHSDNLMLKILKQGCCIKIRDHFLRTPCMASGGCSCILARGQHILKYKNIFEKNIPLYTLFWIKRGGAVHRPLLPRCGSALVRSLLHLFFITLRALFSPSVGFFTF